MPGLSPRVWGNQFPTERLYTMLRPIPTCVGQPRADARSACQDEAYPHVCGATNAFRMQQLRCSGLSPRVWGNRRLGTLSSPIWRPIPTCVGQPDPCAGPARA